MCDKCKGNCGCGGSDEILVRSYTIEREGPQGPAGEVPTPILSNNLFDI